MSSVVLQQTFEKISNHGCSGDVHDDGNDTQLRKEKEMLSSINCRKKSDSKT